MNDIIKIGRLYKSKRTGTNQYIYPIDIVKRVAGGNIKCIVISEVYPSLDELYLFPYEVYDNYELVDDIQ